MVWKTNVRSLCQCHYRAEITCSIDKTLLVLSFQANNKGNSSLTVDVIAICAKIQNLHKIIGIMIKLNKIITENNLSSQPGLRCCRLYLGLLLVQVACCLRPPHLGILAALLRAHRAGHQHLGLDRLTWTEEEGVRISREECERLTCLEMCGHNVCQAVDKSGVYVWSSTPSDSLRPDLLANVVSVLDIQLVKGLDMIVDESDGDKHEILLALLHHDLDGVFGAGLEPGQGPPLALPDQSKGVGPAELLHHQLDSGAHLSRVGVAAVHHVLRDGVGGEEEDHLAADTLGEGVELSSDVLGECLDEERMCRPPEMERLRER